MSFGFRSNYSDLTRADGWFASFEYRGETTYTPVACWAVSDDGDGCKYAVGLIADSEFPELREAGDYPFFAGYVHKFHLVEFDDELPRHKINKQSN